MAPLAYTDHLDYEERVTLASPFPEWIQTDRLWMERLSGDTAPLRELQQAFDENNVDDGHFTLEEGFGNTYQDVFELVEYSDSAWESGEDAYYLMYAGQNSETGDFVGLATIEHVKFDKRRVELGIWLREEHWGEGYSQERAEAVLEVLFNHLSFEVADILVIPENVNSVRAVSKYIPEFGGSFDGRSRNATFDQNGAVYDVYRWSVSADEFNDTEATFSTIEDPTVSEYK